MLIRIVILWMKVFDEGECFARVRWTRVFYDSRNFIIGKPLVLFLPIAIGIVMGTKLLEP